MPPSRRCKPEDLEIPTALRDKVKTAPIWLLLTPARLICRRARALAMAQAVRTVSRAQSPVRASATASHKPGKVTAAATEEALRFRMRALARSRLLRAE